jgi:CRISPR/Cas system CSM-associated protein Csm3 (group 7 of RAMP superfamily)
MNSQLMTLKDFALRIGVSYSTVRRMVADKKVIVIRPCRRPMIPSSEIAKFCPSVVVFLEEL